MLLKELASHIKITNVITTADLLQTVDIQLFNDFLWGRFDIENNYNGKVGYVKDDAMQGRVTVFASGKLISVGAKSVRKSIEQLHKTRQLLIRNGFIKRVELEPKVQNVVATLDLKSKIDLNSFSLAIPRSIFEPEQFPGLIHKVGNGVTALIFSSGKIVIAGAKSENQLNETAKTIEKRVEAFLSPYLNTYPHTSENQP